MENSQNQIQIQIELTKNLMNEVSLETERLEKFTDRILSKLSSIITISSIITFLSFAFVTNDRSLALVKYYLTWVMPYLILGIILWILTLKKSAATTLQNLSVIVSEDPKVTLQYLGARLQMHQQLHGATHTIYQETRKLFSISLGFIVAYLANYVLSFYLFVFGRLPTLPEAVLVTVISLLLAYIFQEWYRRPMPAVNVEAQIRIAPVSQENEPEPK